MKAAVGWRRMRRGTGGPLSTMAFPSKAPCTARNGTRQSSLPPQRKSPPKPRVKIARTLPASCLSKLKLERESCQPPVQGRSCQGKL